MNTSAIIARAIRALSRNRNATQIAEEPSEHASEIKKIEGRTYAVLRNIRGTLAVYRVSEREKLRRLDPGAWPVSLKKA